MAARPPDLPISCRSVPAVLLWFLLACIFIVPVVLRLAAGDDDPDNAIVHEQENQLRRDPDAEMQLAA